MEHPREQIEDLQIEWKTMYQTLLPGAAKAKSSTQLKWPVTLDHCFARIILDATIGIDAPWPTKLKSPAYKHMSETQLRECIELGRRVLEGEEDLVKLDEQSLELRGKTKGGKRKRGVEQDEAGKRIRRTATKEALVQETNNSAEQSDDKSPYFIASTHKPSKSEDLTPQLKRIALSTKTPFQKQVLSLLCEIPRGQYTTYGAISKHLSSSPRAVGNAMRNNPFAPQVPCHRVLASGGGIGGFHGSWGRKGEEGLHDGKKRDLLREEGVRFDGKGKVVGAVWHGFVEGG